MSQTKFNLSTVNLGMWRLDGVSDFDRVREAQVPDKRNGKRAWKRLKSVPVSVSLFLVIAAAWTTPVFGQVQQAWVARFPNGRPSAKSGQCGQRVRHWFLRK